MDPSESLLTTEDVANFLRVDVVTVRRLVSRNEIGAYRIGNEFRFSSGDVQAYLERQHIPARPGSPGMLAPEMVFTRQGEGLLVRIKDQLRGGKQASAVQPRQGGLLESFTRLAKQALDTSQEEARRLGQPYVGTEHLLLALVREQEGVAGQVLSGFGITLEAAREAALKIVGRGEAADNTGQLELTASAKKAIKYGLDEARKLGHSYIGTEHLLLGLMHKGEGVAAGVLEVMGYNLQSIRDAVFAALPSGQGTAPARPVRKTDVDVERGFLERLVGRRRPKAAGGPLSKMTKLAKRGLDASVQEAQALSKAYIGTDHVLLGLIQTKDGRAAQALAGLGVDYDAARKAAASLTESEPVEMEPRGDEIPLSAPTQHMIEGAFNEARQLGHPYVGTEHLVLGLLTLEDSAGYAVLKSLEIDLERLRADLVAPLEGGPA